MSRCGKIQVLSVFFISILFFFSCATLSPELKKANELNQQAMKLNKQGSYSEAIPLAKKALVIREKELGPDASRIVIVADPQGIVFISNRKNWLYRSLWKLTDKEVSNIAESLQFGKGPWIWSGLEQKDEKHLIDRSGKTYLFHKKQIRKIYLKL